MRMKNAIDGDGLGAHPEVSFETLVLAGVDHAQRRANRERRIMMLYASKAARKVWVRPETDERPDGAQPWRTVEPE